MVVSGLRPAARTSAVKRRARPATLCVSASCSAWTTAAASSSSCASAGFTRAQAKRLGDRRAGGPPDRVGVSLRQRWGVVFAGCKGRMKFGPSAFSVQGSSLGVGIQAASSTRWRSKSKPPRPFIMRLIVFSLLICPSTGPVLHGSDRAARTATRSRFKPLTKPAKGVPSAVNSQLSSSPARCPRTIAGTGTGHGDGPCQFRRSGDQGRDEGLFGRVDLMLVGNHQPCRPPARRYRP